MSSYRACINNGCRRKAIDATVPEPYEYHAGKHLTLFGWTIFIYKNTPEYQTDVCLTCSLDQQSQPLRDAYDAGREDAYYE